MVFFFSFSFGLYSEPGEECELCGEQEGRAPPPNPGAVTGTLHGAQPPHPPQG